MVLRMHFWGNSLYSACHPALCTRTESHAYQHKIEIWSQFQISPAPVPRCQWIRPPISVAQTSLLNCPLRVISCSRLCSVAQGPPPILFVLQSGISHLDCSYLRFSGRPSRDGYAVSFFFLAQAAEESACRNTAPDITAVVADQLFLFFCGDSAAAATLIRNH